ncbi:MAG: hypothetical protein JWQ09_344 [Segetibacter sp.]|nr:hypothetical protein [Segetibacter sp.]
MLHRIAGDERIATQQKLYFDSNVCAKKVVSIK